MNVIDLETIRLEKGEHDSPEAGMCVMEAAAYFAGEKHSDHPQCVSPVLGEFLRNWNDSVDDEFRQKLKPFIARVVGTANDGKDEARAWMATDWLVRVCAPSWLHLGKLTERAMALIAADEIADAASAGRILQPALKAAKLEADVAWAVEWDALQPTVEALQASALELLDRMVSA